MKTNFKKVHTAKDLIISSIVLLAGVGTFFIEKGLGTCLVVCALVMLLIYKDGYRKDGEGVVLHKKSEDLCKCCKASIIDFLSRKDGTPEIRKGNEGGCIRLDVYYNTSEGIAYAQLFDFRGYNYEPETDVVELHSPEAEKLVSLLC